MKKLPFPSLTFDILPLLEEDFDLNEQEIDGFGDAMQESVFDEAELYLRDQTTENWETLRDCILSARATAG